MKVLHISTYDIRGGAARAAFRLHNGLVNDGIESQMLVQKKLSDDPNVQTPNRSKLGELYVKARPYVNTLVQKFQKTENLSLHSANITPSGLHRSINKSNVDIVHIHWINKEMISIRELSRINKPIVWTLHDMWAFCGSEHIDSFNSPDRFKVGYNANNRPENHYGIDIDRWTWNRKRKYWANLNMNIVTPSKWLRDCAEKSILFGHHKVSVIPNGLDTKLFNPTGREVARKILNLPQDRQIITFGALDMNKDPNKGYLLLKEALHKYVNSGIKKENIYFSVFGDSRREQLGKVEGVTTRYFGVINNDNFLSLIYSASDVIVVPSKVEAFGQTASEAISCGTPVIAFNTSGLKDIVDHKKNGYLAEPYNTEDLADGIAWILEDEEKLNNLKEAARNKALNKFDIKKVVQQYILLYKTILDNRPSDPLS